MPEPDRDDWDYDNPTRHAPSKSPRAIVSVAFSRTELEQVTAAARERGMKLSAYIRESALRRQPVRPEPVITHSLGGIIRGTRTLATRPRLFCWKEATDADA